MEINKTVLFERAAERIGVPRGPQPARKNTGAPVAPRKVAFRELFEKALGEQEGIRLSRHVQERIAQRQVPFDAGSLANLGKALELARQKGIRDSLVMIEDTAFIVNVPNRTVITALGKADAGQVFTNIDGAIFI